MEINVSEVYKNNDQDLKQVCQKLSELIDNKSIELYEYDEKSETYELVDNYNVKSVLIWEEDQLAFSFGPDEYDVCSINPTDLIKIVE